MQLTCNKLIVTLLRRIISPYKNSKPYLYENCIRFKTSMASTYQLSSMILPQLENDSHGVDVIGMFFFDDNIFCLKQNDSVGERLSKIARDKGMLLMVCDQCAVRRGLAEGTFEQCGSGDVKAKGLVEGVVAGCFPQLYSALGSNPPDQVITL